MSKKGRPQALKGEGDKLLRNRGPGGDTFSPYSTLVFRKLQDRVFPVYFPLPLLICRVSIWAGGQP